MIPQYQIIQLIKTKMPVLAGKDCPAVPVRTFNSIHGAIHYLSDCTRNTMEHKHFAAAKKCFYLAEQLYLEGDAMVRLLIENVFVYSNVWTKRKDKTAAGLPENLIPETLYKVHLKQMTCSGC